MNALKKHSDGAYLESIGGQSGLDAVIARIRDQAGREVEVLEERSFRSHDRILYHRVSRFEKLPNGRLDLSFALDGRGLLGLRFGKAGDRSPGKHHDLVSKTKLRLPFSAPPPGYVWQVIWAGNSILDNYHGRGDVHYAIDFGVGRPNDPVKPAPSDDPCWGQPILSAAAGRVVTVVDDFPDEPDRAAGPGNRIVLDHGNGEYTLYAHLLRGRMAVKEGEHVLQGQELGRCGNSGASTGPHLHFQLMSSPDLSTAEGLPLWFYDYFAPIRHVERGQLLRGELVLPGASSHP